MGIALGYAIVLPAYALPLNLHDQSSSYLRAFWVAFMVRTFDFYLGVAVGLGIVLLCLKRHWRAAVSAVPLAIVLLLGPLRDCLPRPAQVMRHTPLRVMSANLLKTNLHSPALIDRIQDLKPDLILLQEFTPFWRAALDAALATEFPYSISEPRRDSFGVAIYSRLPFVEPPRCDLQLGSVRSPNARAVINVAGQDVAVYSVHVMPPSTIAYIREQRAGFADLLKQLQNEKLPMILSGDFNATGNSAYVDALHERGLRDSHELAGWGRASTWPAIGPLRYLPGVRIDHIFLSPQLTAARAIVVPVEGSDHRGLLAEVGLRP